MIPPKPEECTIQQDLFLRRKATEMLEAHILGHLTLSREEVFELVDRVYSVDDADNLNVLLAAERIMDARAKHDATYPPKPFDIG